MMFAHKTKIVKVYKLGSFVDGKTYRVKSEQLNQKFNFTSSYLIQFLGSWNTLRLYSYSKNIPTFSLNERLAGVLETVCHSPLVFKPIRILLTHIQLFDREIAQALAVLQVADIVLLVILY